jgi:drug/metabolite transporter (DMT)-like permease
MHTLSQDGEKLSKGLVIHTLVRGYLFVMNTFLIIKAGYYSTLAGIAFGVISSIFSLAAALNTLIAHFYFKEHLSYAKYIGIAVILAGVAWISMLKTNSQ